ncbi:serine O-acetyltransferase [Chondromyces apiculatus]|uniref:Serine acetyltransferase n=1 Tax=Chondromyces apiculatus DSM 436 TaxID=1192034 RepID=A0A017SVU3_9BACT|nr:serine acetyltransferase [Chondromyces apiculatus]EYF00897.1 Serine acetyltransferase [Chondromyces apiculatus DSM 436]
MFKTLRTIANDLREKSRWCYERDDVPSLVKTVLTDGTTAMILYRLMQASNERGLAPLTMVFNKLNSVVGGAVIGRGADFGPGFVLIHSDGVVINGSVKGGRNIKIEHQVTIGAERRQSPIIGDDVFIGAGAKIVGSVKIGAGARIGANAVVVHDVPPNTTVVGIPAKPVRRREEAATTGEGIPPAPATTNGEGKSEAAKSDAGKSDAS